MEALKRKIEKLDGKEDASNKLAKMRETLGQLQKEAARFLFLGEKHLGIHSILAYRPR